MSRSSARKAQVEPLPALVAVTVICLAIGAFATVRADVALDPGGNAPATTVLADTVDSAPPTDSVVVDPAEIDPSTSGPSGYELNVVVEADGHEWSIGPSSPPPDAATASRPVPVRVEPGVVRPGRITVEVWS